MNKKIILSVLISLAICFSFTFVFATDGMQNAANGVSNVVNKTEGAVENTAKDAGNAVGNVADDAANGVKDAVNGITGEARDSMDKAGNTANNMGNAMTSNDNGGYTATRTAVDDGTLLGMNATTWTWVILGLAAIAIIALVWYYSMQFTDKTYDDNNQ